MNFPEINRQPTRLLSLVTLCRVVGLNCDSIVHIGGLQGRSLTLTIFDRYISATLLEYKKHRSAFYTKGSKTEINQPIVEIGN